MRLDCLLGVSGCSELPAFTEKQWVSQLFGCCMQAESSVFAQPTMTLPAQLLAIHKLGQGLSHKMQDQSKRFCELLTSMLRPQAQERIFAKQMHNLKWLRDAAKVPLPKCPVSF